MQLFGMISILITAALMVWWFTGAGTSAPATIDPGTREIYQESINMAEDATASLESVTAGQVEGVADTTRGTQVTVYDGVKVSSNASVLDLSGRGLSGSLKAEVRQLTRLKTLDISHNNFTGIPAEVGQLSQLEVLNLSYNPVTGLPYELGNLSNLKVLDLRGTNYSEIDLSVIKQTLPATTQILVD